MKTLKEVEAHVDKVGYNQLAIQKIEGFLLGYGLLGEEFEMEYMIGEHDFDDFRNWFNGVEAKKQEINWGEFGFGDFIHVQDGIDVVLLGGVNNGRFVCVNGLCEVNWLFLLDESRPCNEEEIELLVKKFNERGISFCFVDNEFVSKKSCEECIGCDVKQQVDYDINELYENYEELCKIAESMSEDNPCKGMAKAIVEMVGAMVDGVKESTKSDSELIDELEIDAKEAIENIIANIHAGTMDEKERENVVSALKGLVELGNMYE
jgi:hypothetical protein